MEISGRLDGGAAVVVHVHHLRKSIRLVRTVLLVPPPVTPLTICRSLDSLRKREHSREKLLSRIST